MIRKFVGSVLVLGLLASVSFAQDQEEKPWFDMENCDICKHMAGHEQLMTKVHWEIYKISNGFIAISVVDDDAKEEMNEVKKEMEKTIAKAMAGEQLNMCQHCTGYGDLMAAGAKLEELETVGGDVTLFTSTDSDVVEQLHEFADKTAAAHKKMLKEMGHEHDHGHDHGKKKDG